MDIISTPDSGPSLNLEQLAAALSGTVVYGWFVGFTDLVGMILSGATSSYRGLGEWLSGSLIPALFAIALDPAATAYQSNIEFIESLGIAGYPVAAVELLVVGWLLIQISSISIEIIDGVTSA